MHIAVLKRNFDLYHLATVAVVFVVFSFTNISGTINFTSRAQAETLNQSRSFNIDTTYDVLGRSKINATMHDMSDHAYFFVEDEYWNALNNYSQSLLLQQISELKDQFENKIYPIETGYFGSDPNPGIDGDPHIYIMLTRLNSTAGGYYDTSNEYPISQVTNSNEMEIIYLNVSSMTNSTKFYSFLAHEFQHLISFNQKEKLRGVTDDTWLNEARSEFAISLVGYNDPFQNSNVQRRFQSYIVAPSDSLTEWKNNLDDYGQIAMFGEYIAEHWPSNLFADIEKSNKISIPSIDDALAREGSSDTFTDVFRDWLVAGYFNNTSVDSKFGYTRPELSYFHVVPNQTVTNLSDDISVPITENFKDWAGHWYEISNFLPGQKSVLRVRFTSSSITSFQVPYLVYRSDGTVRLGVFEPKYGVDTLTVSGIGSDLQKVVLMPFKHDKVSGFSNGEFPVSMTMAIDRTTQVVATPAPTPSVTPTPTPAPSPLPSIKPAVKPEDFGLHEGDFIQAKGDIDVYIINEYGYKRLILNPQICFLYGHLASRGCFASIKVVEPSVRDAFKTSWLYTNGETNDGKVYLMVQTGEDTADLDHVALTGDQFVSQGGDFNSVFRINSKEQNLYSIGPNINTLPN